MSAEMDDFTKKLLERTQNRTLALQSKTQDMWSRKKRPLEEKDENIVDDTSEKASEKDGNQTESPNKRSRTERSQGNEVIGSNTASSESNSKPSKQGKASTLGDRMKRLLDKRMQWEVAEKGDEVYLEPALSVTPDSGESPVPLPSRQRNAQQPNPERKARFAALAQEINDREDDLSHPVIKESPEKVKQWKPPTGRKTPMSQVYEEDVHSREGSPVEKPPVTKNVSKRVSLSIETLAQFAGKKTQFGKGESAPRTPNNLPTTIQGKLNKDMITLGSCSQPSSHQVTPTSKSLQQRVLELQKNGVDSELHERQKELSNLRNVDDKENGSDEDTDENDEMAVTDPIAIVSNNNSPQKDFPHISIEPSEQVDSSDIDREDRSLDGSLLEDAASSSAERSDLNAISEEELSCGEEEGSEASYGDSMMDDNEEEEDLDQSADEASLCSDSAETGSFNDSADYSASSNILSLDEEFKSLLSDNDATEEHETSSLRDQEDSALIDMLFDGMEEEEGDPPEEEESPFLDVVMATGSLSRQKSRQEIRSELITRNQTCNEAEFAQKPSAPLKCSRPLARSNSTESLTSLKDHQPTHSYPVFTLDSYRTQRKSTRQFEKVVRKDSMSSLVSPTHESSTVKEQVAEMMVEVQQQQRVIQQASAALNCCYDAQHGKGSITELEAEKLLLIASEKRLALLSEIQALKSKPLKVDSKACKGSITLSEIKLPLRTEYIISMSSKKDGGELKGRYYFILVRCGARYISATHLASTHESLSADSLVFKNKFQLDNLNSEFKIDIEVYSVKHQSRADGVPNHEKPKGKFSGILQKSLTPRKNKSRGAHSRVLNHHASPGGPNAIRISNFSPIGSVSISLREIKQNTFALDKLPYLSQLSGQIVCKFETNFQSCIEQRGFLTMFNDVGGLGAWHRRWCYLKQGVLYSWTYPDDEKTKEPLSQLKVSECISKEISMVGRIMCARPNTFEFRTMRPRKQGDCDNLISQDTGSVITTKYWLAADTKEEREVWISSLNQALNDVRAWDPNALKPFR